MEPLLDEPVLTPADPRLTRSATADIPGADQMAHTLSLSPRERLRYLVETLEFEERLHRARPVARSR